MKISYSRRLNLLYGLCLVDTGGDASTLDIEQHDPLESATFLACYLTFKAIQQAERSPADERIENFDMLSVYQAFAMLVYAYITLPLGEEDITSDLDEAAVTIAKSLFPELSTEELAEIVESGMHKFQLIGGAEQEHWMTYREDLDKTVVAFVVAGTDENAPFEKDDVIPLFGSLLSMLCEAFAS